MPPPNTEPDYQPSALAQFNWTEPREIALFMQMGLVTNVRKEAYKLLGDVQLIGGLPVELHKIANHRDFTLSAKDTWKKYRESYFCPVLMGDAPFQKRFFDVALSGCLPVVVASTSSDGNQHRSWFQPNHLGHDIAHPFADVIDYSEFVVELDSLDDIVPTLELLLEDKVKLQKMQAALGRAAPKFVYGLGDDMFVPGDAFDEILRRLEEYVSVQP